jgi:hypothetical protein
MPGNGTNETPLGTSEPTAADRTSEPTPSDRANGFGRGTDEPRHPLPRLPADRPASEPAAPARRLNRHQRRRLAALARLGLRSAA